MYKSTSSGQDLNGPAATESSYPLSLIRSPLLSPTTEPVSSLVPLRALAHTGFSSAALFMSSWCHQQQICVVLSRVAGIYKHDEHFS